MVKVIIVISGGCLSSVFSSEEIEYNLIDYDNIDGGQTVSEEFFNQDKIMNEEAMQKFINKVKEMNSKKVPEDEK